MSHEIKFRGKRVDNGEWVTGSLVLNRDDSLVEGAAIKSYIEGYSFEFSVDPESIGQSTGLKDKNGIEIYEGDAVAIEASDSTVKHLAVRWSNTNSGFWIGSNYLLSTGVAQDCEVIGTIHDQKAAA